MDRRFFSCVAMVLMAAVLGFMGGASANIVPFEDGFETTAAGAYPSADGWLVLSTGMGAAVTDTVFCSGEHSFRLDSWPFSARMDYVALEAIPERLTYEAAVRVDATNGRAGIVGFMDRFNGDLPIWNSFWIDGDLGRVFFYGTDEVDLGPYTPGDWCTVRADLNYDALTADLWVNDAVVAEGVEITPFEMEYPPLGPIWIDQWGVGAPATSSFSNVVYFDDLQVYETDLAVSVDIDVKPGSEQNPINLGARGLLPVCVFSSETFDARLIDPATVDCAGAPVALRGRNARFMAHPEDIDGDGLLDLVLQFEVQRLDREQLAEGWASLSGATSEGQEFVGSDEVVLVGRAVRARGHR